MILSSIIPEGAEFQSSEFFRTLGLRRAAIRMDLSQIITSVCESFCAAVLVSAFSVCDQRQQNLHHFHLEEEENPSG